MDAKIETPDGLKIDGSLDHGMVLVHELGGKPSHFLHELSIPEFCSDVTERKANEAGYKIRSGWVDRTYSVSPRQMWLWSKKYPLSVRDAR